MAEALELTILMPCLNEAETLAASIAAARSFLERTGVAGEILVADNGSTDGSPDIARAEGARLVQIAQKGYGAALAGGIAAARGRFVVMGDCDLSYDFSRLDPFLAELRAGAALVMGNRFKGGIAPGAMPPLNRYIGNPLLSFIGRLFFGTRIGDFHCGLRGFDRDAVRALKLRTSGMEFASEMVVKASLAGLPIAEVPTTLSPDGRSRPPHLRPLRDGWRHLRFLLLFSPRWLFLYPGLALVAFGLLLGLVLARGPVRIGAVILDIHGFLVAAMAVIVGMQSISFALIGRIFATRYGFIPPSGTYHRLLEAFTLERILAAAFTLMVVGMLALGWGLAEWAERGFGVLAATATIRALILALTALVVGFQLMMSGFMSSMLNIPLYENRVIEPPPDAPPPPDGAA